MVSPWPHTASLNLHPAHVIPLIEWSELKRGIANSVAVDDSDAGECARDRLTIYRQAKGGLNSPENINILICNINLVNYGAPTRILVP